MKRLSKVLCLTLAFLMLVFYEGVWSEFIVPNSNAMVQSTTYAKASANCILYRTSSLKDDQSNIYFVVPETYFVSVIENISDTCMKVQYKDYVGFIDSSTAVIATFIPIVKSLDGITFDIKETSGTQIWSKPSSNSNVLTTIPANKKNINYIAFAYGDIPNGGESNLWFYVSYTPENNSTNVYEGYVYSENVTNLSEIIANAESNPEVIVPNENNEPMIVISSSIRTLLIALISIPVIILLAIIMYKIVKKYRENTNRNRNFDENENIVSKEEFENSETMHSRVRLKEQISNLKSYPFVRKNKNANKDSNAYPTFPSYDPDDDLL